MAVDRLKELSVPRTMSLAEAYQEMENIYTEFYEEVVTKSFKSFLGLCSLYQPNSLAESRQKQADLLKLVEAHRIAATNRQGEYKEGVSIFDRVKNILSKVSELYAQDGSLYAYAEQIAAISDHLPMDKLYFAAEQIAYGNFASYGEFFSESDKWHNRYIYDLTQVLFRSYEIKLDQLDPSNAVPSLSALQPPIELKEAAALRGDDALLFSALFEKFMDHKISMNNLTLENQKEYRNYFDVVLHFIGDLPIDTITKRHIKGCLTQYGTLPRRNEKPYKYMKLEEILKIEVPDSDRVAPKTVGQVRRLIQGIFRYAVDQELVKQSPAVDLNLDLEKTNARGAYSKTQLKALLAGVDSFNGKDEWKKWVLRLGVYTGARAGEIAQLRGQDVKQDEDSGIYYLLITKEAGTIKTDNALRRIPLHSALIEMGFLDYVRRQEGKVFPTLNDSAPISKWFPLYRKSQGIADSTDFDEKLVFHGFRHSLVTSLRGAGANDAQVQQIVGHEKTGAGITDRYTQRIELPALKTVIELIQY